MKIAPAVTAIQSLKASPLAGAENHVNVCNAKTTNNAVTDETLLPAAYDVAIEGIAWHAYRTALRTSCARSR